MVVPARKVTKLCPLDERHSITADELEARWSVGRLPQGLAKDKLLPTSRTITKSPKQLAKKAEGSKRGVHLVPRWMECEDHWQARAPQEVQPTDTILVPVTPSNSCTSTTVAFEKPKTATEGNLKMAAMAAGSFREAQKHRFADEEHEDAHAAACAILANASQSGRLRKAANVRQRGLLRFLRGVR